MQICVSFVHVMWCIPLLLSILLLLLDFDFLFDDSIFIFRYFKLIFISHKFVMCMANRTLNVSQCYEWKFGAMCIFCIPDLNLKTWLLLPLNIECFFYQMYWAIASAIQFLYMLKTQMRCILITSLIDFQNFTLDVFADI